MKCAYRKTNLGPGYTVVSCCLAALLTLTVLETRTAIADGRGYACQLYSEITPDPEVFCSIVTSSVSGPVGSSTLCQRGRIVVTARKQGGGLITARTNPCGTFPSLSSMCRASIKTLSQALKLCWLVYVGRHGCRWVPLPTVATARNTSRHHLT